MKRNHILTSILSLALLLPAAAWAGGDTWQIDPAHSDVGFAVRHFFTPVKGEFTDFAGSIHYDPETVANSSVEITVQAASIDTDNDNRDQHLRSDDFFGVETHPTLSFKSTKVESAGEGELAVTGHLTMHGVTKEVTVPVQFLGSMATPMGTRAGFSTEFTLDRKEYGITWNRALDQGGAVLGDEVTVEIHIEARLAEETQAGK